MTFIKVKATIRSSYMFVHICCCILFCIEWFDSKLKREFKTHLKIALEIYKRKRKRNSLTPLSLRGFWPARPSLPRRPSFPPEQPPFSPVLTRCPAPFPSLEAHSSGAAQQSSHTARTPFLPLLADEQAPRPVPLSPRARVSDASPTFPSCPSRALLRVGVCRRADFHGGWRDPHATRPLNSSPVSAASLPSPNASPHAALSPSAAAWISPSRGSTPPCSPCRFTGD